MDLMWGDLFLGLFAVAFAWIVGTGAMIPRSIIERERDRWRVEAEIQKHLIREQEEQVKALTAGESPFLATRTLPMLKESSGPKSFSFIEGETAPHVHLPEPVTTLFTEEVVAHICRECYDECAAPMESGGYYVAVIDEPHKVWLHTTWLRPVVGGPAVQIGTVLP